jgi:hypothetical protein
MRLVITLFESMYKNVYPINQTLVHVRIRSHNRLSPCD